jgi:hypothetical protein
VLFAVWTLAGCLALSAAQSAVVQPPAEPASPVASEKRWPGQGHPSVEKVRKCIMQREAGGNYRAVDPSRHWFGAYQFSMSASNTAARRMGRKDLIGVPASKWAPADQDAAFYVIYDHGRGKRAWRGGRYPCF